MMHRICFLLLWFVFSLTPSAQAGTQVQSFRGPAGMRVYLLESHASPMLEMRLVTRGGSVYDPPDKAGLASLTAWMFNEGAGEMDSATFQERLAFHGILMDATASLETLVVKVTTLSAHWEEAGERLADAVLRPRLEEKALLRAVAEQRASLIKNLEQPQHQAALLLQKNLYPNHPYGRPVAGTLEGLSRVTLADVRDFHADAFHGPAMVLAVAGDVDRSALQAFLHRHFAALDATPSPMPAIPPVVRKRPAGSPATEHLEMDLPQTTLQLGTIAIRRRDPDYYAFYVLNQLLGGVGLTGRLGREIREKRGLTYGVYSRFSPLSQEGPFVISMQTKTASTQEALLLLRQQLQAIVQEEVPEEELDDVIRYLTGSFPLHQDGLGKLAALWGSIGFHKLGMDYLEKWPERIRAVRREDVARVARRILDLEQFCTV
ncbi:MAG: insulinase family protein, partial [Magnetococcales bacterium]|nr:insulinase family protein [Magnetococcales bacterium]